MLKGKNGASNIIKNMNKLLTYLPFILHDCLTNIHLILLMITLQNNFQYWNHLSLICDQIKHLNFEAQ